MVKKKKGTMGRDAAIGAGMAALGAGAYYLLGPKAKQHQGKAKVLAAKIKLEVGKKLKKAEKISQPIYHNVVDSLAATYSKQYKEHAGEINALAKKLKSEWKKVEKKTRLSAKKAKRHKKFAE